MHLISSSGTYYIKRIVPPAIGGVAVLALVAAYVAGSHVGWAGLLVAGVAVIAVPVGYLILSKTLFNVVDEVWDDGDALVIKDRGREARIALRDIADATYRSWFNPPRVTLRLWRPSVFGPQITFSAPVRVVPLTVNPAIDDLIKRIKDNPERR